MNISISNTLDSISDLLEWKQCCTENCCYQWKTIIHSVLSSSNWFFLPIDFLSSQNVSPINDPQNLGFENICSHQQKHKNELYIQQTLGMFCSLWKVIKLKQSHAYGAMFSTNHEPLDSYKTDSGPMSGLALSLCLILQHIEKLSAHN